jgi:hypothetical protein
MQFANPKRKVHMNESPTRDFKNIFNRHNFLENKKIIILDGLLKLKVQF